MRNFLAILRGYGQVIEESDGCRVVAERIVNRKQNAICAKGHERCQKCRGAREPAGPAPSLSADIRPYDRSEVSGAGGGPAYRTAQDAGCGRPLQRASPTRQWRA